jgi:hypothetical protein
VIYFIRLGVSEDAAIKIGYAANVKARVCDLKRKLGVDVTILGVLPGGRPGEAEFHRRFAHLRLGKPEHFRAASELLSCIETETKSPGNIDASAKVDAELVNKAKHVVLARGLSLAEYLSELLRVPIERDFAKEMRRLAGDQREGKG